MTGATGLALKICQINISERGGMPKKPVERASVSFSGVKGDYNEYRMTQLKGDLDSAVLILPLNTIMAYQEDGYDVYPGAMGENFTVNGIDYESIKLGQKYRVGKEVIIEITRPCNPCHKLLVYGQDFVKKTEGKRGYYAKVLAEGTVNKMDDFVPL